VGAGSRARRSRRAPSGGGGGGGPPPAAEVAAAGARASTAGHRSASSRTPHRSTASGCVRRSGSGPPGRRRRGGHRGIKGSPVRREAFEGAQRGLADDRFSALYSQALGNHRLSCCFHVEFTLDHVGPNHMVKLGKRGEGRQTPNRGGRCRRRPGRRGTRRPGGRLPGAARTGAGGALRPGDAFWGSWTKSFSGGGADSVVWSQPADLPRPFSSCPWH